MRDRRERMVPIGVSRIAPVSPLVFEGRWSRDGVFFAVLRFVVTSGL
jgi:hypothetical protein